MAGEDAQHDDLRQLRASLRRLPACRECVRSWRILTGGRLVGDPERRTLVACSGGADSTALLLCLWAAARKSVVVGHVVHDMRSPEESEADAAAVQALCSRLRVTFVRDAVFVRGAGGNAESTARRMRYARLLHLANGHACAFVATGHQGDDQVETMLMRLVRGTGVRGLSGIAPTRTLGVGPLGRGRVKLVRPMLEMSRADCEDVCRAAGVAWREDATNADASRWRVRLRRDVLPVLRELRPGLAARAAATAAGLREAAAIVEHDGLALLEQARNEGETLVWPRASVQAVGPVVLGEMLRRARRRLAGDLGADRLGARDLRAIWRGLQDPDRRARSWEIGGMRVRLDSDTLALARLPRRG